MSKLANEKGASFEIIVYVFIPCSLFFDPLGLSMQNE